MRLGLISFAFVMVNTLACAGGRPSKNAGAGGAPADSGATSAGVCASSCDKPCTADQDCDTNVGELCCDFGSRGKICQSAKACPKLCSGGAGCTAAGQSCVQTTLASPQLTCEPASTGLGFCETNADCGTSGAVCCGDYAKSFCVPGTRCPTPCTTTAECDATSGEVCCTSAKLAEPSLKVAGLCLNPKVEVCPVACATSADCSGTGQLCCNGLCADTCPKSCSTSADCGSQICCTTTEVKLPPPPLTFRTSMECGGAPSPATCLACATTAGVGCARCLGCSVQASLAGCKGTATYASCDACDKGPGCANCPGCSVEMTCTGTATACSGFAQQDGCIRQGCTWDLGSSTCSGTVPPCPNLLGQAHCSAELGCSWTIGCAGPTPSCATYNADATTCAKEPGCNWVPIDRACAGTVTPCEQIPPDFCTSQMGCALH